MLICTQCNRTFGQGSKFCSNCGAPLTELPNDAVAGGQHHDTGMTAAEGYGNPQSAGIGSPGLYESSAKQAADFPAGYGAATNSAGHPAASQAGTAAEKTGAGVIAGMFLVNCIPVLGFPVAFIWAQAKMKKAKGKLVAFTAAFLVLNIAVTIFAYALSINMMKNSLAKAAQSVMAETNHTGGNQKLPGQQADPSADTPTPGNGEDNPVQGDPGLDSGLLEQFIPGFAGIQGEQGYNPGNYPIPEGITIPETDENGNMYIDTDGDGVADMIIDKEGNIVSSDAKTPSIDSSGNVFVDLDGDGKNDMIIDPSGNIAQSSGLGLPKTDEHGNMYLDTDDDGEYDSYLDSSSGMIIPMDNRAKTDAKGNRFIDYDGDGKYEFMVDTEGVTHFDADGDGVYETTLDQSQG